MILITGGTGFIGSNLLACLSTATNEPIAICDVFGSDNKWQNVAIHRIDEIVHPSELSDFLERKKGRISAVFHLGAISSTTERDVDLIISSNFQLSCQLWNYCTEVQIPFIYASSAATYGAGEHGFNDIFEEEALAKLRPLNPYGWSKHLFDRWVYRKTQNSNRLPPQWAGLKFFNVYGPNEYHKGNQKSVIATFYPQILEKKSARLFKSYHPDFKDGEQKRDFIWVGDCVDVMTWLWQNPGVSGLFNVGTGTARTFNDLTNAIFVNLNLARHIEYVDMPDGLKDAYQYFTEADMTRLRHAGYTAPFTSLEDGIHMYITNYLSQSNPYR